MRRRDAAASNSRAMKGSGVIRLAVDFAIRLYRLRGMIYLLAKRDLVSRYVGTLGGPIWAVAQPLATVFVFWFVFAVGFKARGPSNTPFVLYFLAGYLPWLLFTEALNASASSVIANSHLVKKTVFPTEILPLVQVASSTVTHLILLVILMALLAAMGGHLSWTAPQILYYYLCLVSFELGLAWLLASLHVFSRDVGQILVVALNLWFWVTPIVWSPGVLPESVRPLLTLNPMFYVVEGYRNSLLYQIPIWRDPAATLRFWAIVLPCLLSGALVFRRLKPEFADVL